MSSRLSIYDKEKLNNLGATNKFPDGKLTEQDQGEIKIAIITADDKIVIEFGQPVRWIGMSPKQAIDLSHNLLKHSHKLTGKQPIRDKDKMNLAEAVQKEIDRNRKLLITDKTLSAGTFGSIIIKLDIESAETAIVNKDVSAMTQAYKKLKEHC